MASVEPKNELKLPKSNSNRENLDRSWSIVIQVSERGTRDFTIEDFRTAYKKEVVASAPEKAGRDAATVWNLTELWRYIGFIATREGRGGKRTATAKAAPKGRGLNSYFLTEWGRRFIVNEKDEERGRLVILMSLISNTYDKTNSAVKNTSTISMPHALLFLAGNQALSANNLVWLLYLLDKHRNVDLALIEFSESQDTGDLAETMKKNSSFLTKNWKKLHDNKLLPFLRTYGILETVETHDGKLWRCGFLEPLDASKKEGFFSAFRVTKAKEAGMLSANQMLLEQKFLNSHDIDEIKRSLPLPNLEKVVRSISQYKRNYPLRFEAIKNAKFKCEIDQAHETFTWDGDAGDGNYQFMEAHHLLPISESETALNEMGYTVDCIDNLFCLCPTCHRKFTSGEVGVKKSAIKTLYEKRRAIYSRDGINIEFINQIYKV